MVISFALVGCTKTVVKHEFVMGDNRTQAVVDSLQTQIKDCEGALKAWEKFEDFDVKKHD